MFVVQYQLQSDQEDLLGTVPAASIACVNTHDMPPFAAWWQALDADDRQDLGLIDEHETQRDKTDREALRMQLVQWLRHKRPSGGGDLARR